MIKVVDDCVVFRQLGFAPGSFLFSAWEQVKPQTTHDLVRKFSGLPGFWGRIGAARLPKQVSQYPMGHPSRDQAVYQHQYEQYQRAYRLVFSAFQEAEVGTCSGGFISLTTADVDASW